MKPQETSGTETSGTDHDYLSDCVAIPFPAEEAAMPRRARLSLPGIPWHLIQRGHNRAVCFYAEEDYRLYLHHLQELAPRFGCAVHAYVLMTNHVHLLLTPERVDSVALLMKHLGQRYVQYST